MRRQVGRVRQGAGRESRTGFFLPALPAPYLPHLPVDLAALVFLPNATDSLAVVDSEGN